MKFNSQPRLTYMAANYAAYGLNFFSGLILARSLGPNQRGTLSYLTSFYLITLLLVPLNSRNGSTLASIKTTSWKSGTVSFPFRKLYIRVALLSVLATSLFALILIDKIESNSLIIFSISNVTCGLMFYMCFAEGIFRVKENLYELATLRFLGLGIPSIYVLILFAIGKLQVHWVLLSQFFAVVGCFIFLRSRGSLEPSFSYETYSLQVRNTYLGHILEYLCNYMIFLSVAYSSNYREIGLFAIALSFVMISDTFFPLVESRMLRKIDKSLLEGEIRTRKPIIDASKELFASQLVFIPLAFLIPVIYGSIYSGSVFFALALIVAKFNYSMVKLLNTYAAISERFDIPIKLNTAYLLLYVSLFWICKSFLVQSAWQVSSLLASSVVVIIAFAIVKNFLVSSNYEQPTRIDTGN